MHLLAIDTTEDACSAALLADGQVAERFELAPRRHSELILPMMERLLGDAGLRLADLDALAFARGPGSFTGLRIAASVIQGVAFAAALPVVPVSSLQALAQGAARTQGVTAVLAALDARMGEVYWGAFRADAAGIMQAVGGEAVGAPATVGLPDDADNWVGVGSGWAAHPAVLEPLLGALPATYPDHLVHAHDVATLGAALFAAGAVVDAEHALPVYLRDEVAWAKA